MPKLPKDLAALVYLPVGLIAVAVGAVWFAHTQTTKFPLMGEWDLLHGWVEAPSTWDWIWAPQNGQRHPLSKALWLGILRATGYDFAAPQYVSLVLLLSSSVLFLWTARGLRGRSHPADLIFPALMLHLGHGYNLHMGSQVGNVFFAYCIAGWIWCAGRLARGGGPRWAVLSGFYAGMLVPYGWVGLAFAPAVLLWSGYWALRFERSGNRFASAYFTLLHFAVLGYCIWIVLTMPSFFARCGNLFEQPDEFLTGLAGFLSSAAGCWPDSEWEIVTIAVAVIAVYGIGFGMLAKRVASPDPRRVVSAAILLVTIGVVLAAAAAMLEHGNGFADRNTSIGSAGLCAALLGWIATDYLRLRGAASWVSGILALLLSMGMLDVNIEPARAAAFKQRDSIHHLNLDMQAGESPLYLGGKHGGSLGVLMGDRFAEQLRAFQRAGIPPFDKLQKDPPYHLETCPVQGLPLRWSYRDDDFRAGSPAPMVGVPLPPPGAIGLRVGVSTERPIGRMKLTFLYIDPTGQIREAEAQPYYLIGKMHLVFRFAGTIGAPIIKASSPLNSIVIEDAEWIMPNGES